MYTKRDNEEEVMADVLGSISSKLSSLETIENLRKAGVGSTSRIKSSITRLRDVVSPSELLETSNVDLEKVRSKYINIESVNLNIDDLEDLDDYLKLISVSKHIKTAILIINGTYNEYEMKVGDVLLTFINLDKLSLIFTEAYIDLNRIIDTHTSHLITNKGYTVLKVQNLHQPPQHLLDTLNVLHVRAVRIRYSDNDDSILDFVENLDDVNEVIVGEDNGDDVYTFDDDAYELLKDIIDLGDIERLTANNGTLFESEYFTYERVPFASIKFVNSIRDKLNFIRSRQYHIEKLFPNARIEVELPEGLNVDFYLDDRDDVYKYLFHNTDDVDKFIHDNVYDVSQYGTVELRYLLLSFQNGINIVTYPNAQILQISMISNVDQCQLLLTVVNAMKRLKSITIITNDDEHDNEIERLQQKVNILDIILDIVKYVDHVIVDDDKYDIELYTDVGYSDLHKRYIRYCSDFLLYREVGDLSVVIPPTLFANIDGVMTLFKRYNEEITSEKYFDNLYTVILDNELRTVFIKTWSDEADAILDLDTVKEVIIDLEYDNYNIQFDVDAIFPNIRRVLILGNVDDKREYESIFPNARIKIKRTNGDRTFV